MSAGKGDSPRPVDPKKFADGWERIWGKKINPCRKCGSVEPSLSFSSWSACIECNKCDNSTDWMELIDTESDDDPKEVAQIQKLWDDWNSQNKP